MLLFVGAGMLAAFQVGKAPPVLMSIKADLGMSLFLAGWILSTFNVIGLLFGSLAGALADGFGYKRMLLIGLGCQAVGSFSGPLIAAPEFFLATRILEGMGFFMIGVSAPALIFRVTRAEDMRLSLAAWSCFLPGGAALIMLLTPLLTAHFGWRGLWYFNGVFLIAYLLIVVRLTRGLVVPANEAGIGLKRLLKDVAETASSLGPLVLALTFSTYSLQWLTVMGFLPTLLMEVHGIDRTWASILTAIMVGMNVPGNLAGGWLLHRGFTRWKLIVTASIVMGLSSLAIYSYSLPFWISYLGCLSFSGFGGLIPSSVIGGAPVYAPKPALVGTTNGLILQGAQLGQITGPPVLALIVSSTGGWQSAPYLLCSSASAGIVMALVLAVLEKRRLRAES